MDFSKDICIPISNQGPISFVAMKKGLLVVTQWNQGKHLLNYKVFNLNGINWAGTPADIVNQLSGSSISLEYNEEFITLDFKDTM